MSLSYCELCGRQVSEKSSVLIDGTVFSVCVSCSKHGKPYLAPPAFVKKRTARPAAKDTKRILMADETMLAPNFSKIIREARMQMGLTHEQLGMRMSEKANLLRKFETGALKPDEILARKLERFLQIKLYVGVQDDGE